MQLRSASVLIGLIFALNLDMTSARAQGTEEPSSPPPEAPAGKTEEASKATETTDQPQPEAAALPLPPAAGSEEATLTQTEDAPGESAAAPAQTSGADLARIKSEIRAELAAELQSELRAELAAAARDVAGQKAAAVEWQQERWVEEVRPQLNFLEFDGYFRTRGDLFNRLDLGTYDPTLGRGTSGFPTPGLTGNALASCQSSDAADRPAVCDEESQTLTSANMRLRLRPTLNISEDIRLKSTVDIFDNVVLGSLPNLKSNRNSLPQVGLPASVENQLPPTIGWNSATDAIRLKRLWAEVTTPFGQIRFGRQPLHFGLGLLANAGEDIDDDFEDSVDQVLFSTRIAGHYVTPAYAISSAGPIGRGSGFGAAGDGNLLFGTGEPGQRYNLDPRDDIHTFLISVVRKDKEEDIEAKIRAGDWVVNYGAFGYYRTQQYDIPSFVNAASPSLDTPLTAEQYVLRNANAGAGSLWGRFQWSNLRIEAEAVGVVGRIDNTSAVSNGLEAVDPALRTYEDGGFVNQPLWLLQGGAAIESNYSLLNDSLVIGLDAGIASGDSAPGFGLRSGLQASPRLGDADGQQYGSCLRKDAGEDGVRGNEDDRCIEVDNYVNNFRFDPAYNIDLILFREILGTVTDAAYIKPHVSYFITETFGVRGDLIYSNALYDASTPGLSSPLGVEGDGTVFYTSEDGFVLMLQGGMFFPLAGFNQATEVVDNSIVGREINGQRVGNDYLQAQFAYTLQGFLGVNF